MGTDIHGVFQAKNKETGKWEDIPSKYEQNRHYQLFAVLANVRNGYGFAGIPTGEAVKPIAMPRGYPDDFEVDKSEDCHILEKSTARDPRRSEWYSAEQLDLWMGDHTHSWLSGAEMQEWRKNSPTVVRTGVLSKDQYDAWDKKSPPDSYCGGISGYGIIVVRDNAIDKSLNPGWTHIQCKWESLLGEELAYFFDEINRLVEEYGEIRFVFGFDS